MALLLPPAVSWLPAEGARFELAATRAALSSAQKALRERRPDTARLVDRLRADAEQISAQERSKSAWDRTPGRSEAAWIRPLDASLDALASVARQQRSAAARWQEMAPRLAAQVAQAAEEVTEAGMGTREIAAARRAEYQLDLSRRYAASGAYERANVAAVVAMDAAAIVHKTWRDLHSRFGEPRNLRLWRSWVEETIAASRESGEPAIVVDKLKRTLFLYDDGRRVASFPAELGARGLRQKLHAGDQATPEGRYRVVDARDSRRTKFYKALLLDYPNAEDRARFQFLRRAGQVPRRAGPGSLIEIHGEGGKDDDWTDGCVALSNTDMDRVFARARVGTRVTIVGTF